MYWDRLLISDNYVFSASDATHDCVISRTKIWLDCCWQGDETLSMRFGLLLANVTVNKVTAVELLDA